jgi:hypothetical protein
MIRLPHDRTLRVAIYTAVACSVAAAISTAAEIEPAPIMGTVLTFAPTVLVILWLQKDAQRTRVGGVLDWGLFLWFAWPVIIPWYAFKSRGRRGWRLLLGLIALICSTYIAGSMAAACTYALRPGD